MCLNLCWCCVGFWVELVAFVWCVCYDGVVFDFVGIQFGVCLQFSVDRVVDFDFGSMLTSVTAFLSMHVEFVSVLLLARLKLHAVVIV